MLFKNPDLYKQYLRDGFVVLPLLNGAEITQLLELNKACSEEEKSGLAPSLRYGEPAKNLAIHYKIKELVHNAVGAHFENYDYMACHYITKHANTGNEFRLHQDWNVVDERKTIAAHIWCPLQDTGSHNGTLFVAKGSHKYFNNYRSGSLGIAFIDANEAITARYHTFTLKAGEAVVYNQSLFHGSHPNSSDKQRQVVLTSIKPNTQPMMYYHKAGEQNGQPLIEAFELNTHLLFEQLRDLERGVRPVNALLADTFLYDGILTETITPALLESYLIRNELTGAEI